jgi:hypothetical protein
MTVSHLSQQVPASVLALAQAAKGQPAGATQGMFLEMLLSEVMNTAVACERAALGEVFTSGSPEESPGMTPSHGQAHVSDAARGEAFLDVSLACDIRRKIHEHSERRFQRVASAVLWSLAIVLVILAGCAFFDTPVLNIDEALKDKLVTAFTVLGILCGVFGSIPQALRKVTRRLSARYENGLLKMVGLSAAVNLNP